MADGKADILSGEMGKRRSMDMYMQKITLK